MNVLLEIILTFVVSGGNTAIDMTLEALCFFHTENFDNSHEKMEKLGRSSLGVDSNGCYPLLSYKGVSCSSNLSQAVEGIGGLVELIRTPFLCRVVSETDK